MKIITHTFENMSGSYLSDRQVESAQQIVTLRKKKKVFRLVSQTSAPKL